MPYIHLDNNGTTHLSKTASLMVEKYKDCGNPSSSSQWGKKSKEIIEKTQEYMYKWLGTTARSYEIIWTSGATESNCWILTAISRACKKLNPKGKAHIIISSIEHKSMIACADVLKSQGIEISYARPNIHGIVEASEVKRLIRNNTCLISVMSANNETGAINPIKDIGALAHEHKIPFHTDATQLFPKQRIMPSRSNIDAMSISFHKLHGLKGVGALIIKKDFLCGYGLVGLINGSQQNGLRGGTENVCGIASAYGAMKDTLDNRDAKTRAQQALINHFISEMDKKYPRIKYSDIIKDGVESAEKWKPSDSKENNNVSWVLLGPENSKDRLSNTALISFITPFRFCNGKLKDYLCSQHIDISIGSACNTSDPKASHVLTAIGAPSIVRRGTVRVSVSDYSTKTEINKLIKALVGGVKKQCQSASSNAPSKKTTGKK